MSKMKIARIIARELTSDFVNCLRSDSKVSVDWRKAQVQQRNYLLQLCDWPITFVSNKKSFPDGAFVEDTAVILHVGRNRSESGALIANPGAPTRKAETPAVADVLRADFILHRLTSNATLDGGDVLRLDAKTFVVGESERTNSKGALQFAQHAKLYGLETRITKVGKGLHFKSACSLAGEGTVVYDPLAGLDLSVFKGSFCVPVPENLGANVLALGDKRILVSSAAPQTAQLLARLGFFPSLLPLGEIHLALAALSCMSIRWAAPESWAP
jgi:dimethylargininase